MERSGCRVPQSLEPIPQVFDGIAPGQLLEPREREAGETG